MSPESSIRRALLQLLGVGAYFALVVAFYWKHLTDLAAVGVIIGLLFLFKAVVDSGAIGIAHLAPEDPESNIRSPTTELFKALSFFGVGAGAWVDFVKAMQIGLIPANLASAVIHLLIVCSFAICVVACCVRFSVALKNRPWR